MNQKNRNDLIKYYHNLNEERSDMYPLSLQEHMNGVLSSYERLMIASKPMETQIEILMTWEASSSGLKLVKLYEAFVANDMERLNDCLYENAHFEQISNIFSPGTDHTFYSFNILPDLLAANMVDRIGSILPKENGLCTGSYCGSTIVNLFMAIWYQDEEFKKAAILNTEKTLSKKNNSYHEAYVRYLLAILNHDHENASLYLEEICKTTKKMKEFGVNAFTKGFSILAHGMYNLSHYVYDGEMDGKVMMPDTDNFCQELAIWQKQHDHHQGHIVHKYPASLDLLNQVMLCEPPMMHLIQKKPKVRYLDTNQFLQDVIQRVKDRMERNIR